MIESSITKHDLLTENGGPKQSIEAREEPEPLYRKLFEQSIDAIFLVEKITGRYLDANVAAQKLVGKSLSELKSLTTHDLSPRNANERLRRVSASDEAIDFGEVEYIRSDGTERNALLHTVSLDERTVFGIAHDITELRQTKKTLAFIAQCGTLPGDDFFQSLTRYLAETREMDFVCIGRFAGDQTTVQTVTLYVDGKFEDNMSYPFPASAAGNIVEKTIYSFSENIRNAFPPLEALSDMAAESSFGAFLFGHAGQRIGLITLARRRTLADQQPLASLLKLVAIRVAAELERAQVEADLRLHAETLEKLVEKRTAELATRNENLEEINTALHVLLKKREDDKRKVEELIVSNVKSFVYPYIEKMQTASLNAKQRLLISIIETHLNELLSPLLNNIQQFNLTPKELQVATMVKDGKSTKEIAEVLGVETSSIDAHRNRIRKKLALSRNVNLQTKLRSLI